MSMLWRFAHWLEQEGSGMIRIWLIYDCEGVVQSLQLYIPHANSNNTDPLLQASIY